MASVLIVVVGIFAVSYIKNAKVNMNFAKEAETCFIYDSANILHRLNDKELDLLKSIFDDKIMHRDYPSCGFSEDVSIKFNDSQTFCIACDTCPIIYWKEKNKYFKLSENEKAKLYNLLKPYGFVFPCL